MLLLLLPACRELPSEELILDQAATYSSASDCAARRNPQRLWSDTLASVCGAGKGAACRRIIPVNLLVIDG